MAKSVDQEVTYDQNMSEEQQSRRLEHLPSHPLEFGDSDTEVCSVLATSMTGSLLTASFFCGFSSISLVPTLHVSNAAAECNNCMSYVSQVSSVHDQSCLSSCARVAGTERCECFAVFHQ